MEWLDEENNGLKADKFCKTNPSPRNVFPHFQKHKKSKGVAM